MRTEERTDVQVQFAQKAVIVRDGELLLIQKSAADPYHPNRWEIPGGRLEQGESLSESLAREVREEVGIEIEIGPPLAVWSWTLGDAPDAAVVVAVSRFCKPLGSNVSFAAHEDTDYLQTWRWVPMEDVPSMDLIPNARESIVDSLKLIARLENSAEL